MQLIARSRKKSVGEKAIIGINTKDNKLSFDRSRSGNVRFSPSFEAKPAVVNHNPRKEFKVQLFVDKISTELFINDGDAIGCKVDVKDIKVYELK